MYERKLLWQIVQQGVCIYIYICILCTLLYYCYSSFHFLVHHSLSDRSITGETQPYDKTLHPTKNVDGEKAPLPLSIGSRATPSTECFFRLKYYFFLPRRPKHTEGTVCAAFAMG